MELGAGGASGLCVRLTVGVSGYASTYLCICQLLCLLPGGRGSGDALVKSRRGVQDSVHLMFGCTCVRSARVTPMELVSIR